MRFIQLWFLPDRPDHEPAVEQKKVEKTDRTDKFLPLVSNSDAGALRIKSDAAVYSLFLTDGKHVSKTLDPKRGYYLYILEGAPLAVNGIDAPVLSAAMITKESKLTLKAAGDTEILLLDVGPLK
jgi:redox-sensitive bicupin YhaK (pirin superfamily)